MVLIFSVTFLYANLKKRQKSEKIRNFDFSGQERGQNSKYRKTSNPVFEESYKDDLYKSTADFDKNCGFYTILVI